jgi:hypothetical protein
MSACILPIGLLLAHPLGADLGGVPYPQFELHLAQQVLEPTRVPAGFHAHPHTLPFEPGVELLGFFAVRQPTFPQFTGLGIHKCNLLEARMIVKALYLVCICPIRCLCVSGGLDRDSAGGRSHPQAQ